MFGIWTCEKGDELYFHNFKLGKSALFQVGKNDRYIQCAANSIVYISDNLIFWSIKLCELELIKSKLIFSRNICNTLYVKSCKQYLFISYLWALQQNVSYHDVEYDMCVQLSQNDDNHQFLFYVSQSIFGLVELFQSSEHILNSIYLCFINWWIDE